MQSNRRFRHVLLIGGIAVSLIGGASVPRPPLFLYNRTPSMAAGLYVYQGQVIHRGAIVVFPQPAARSTIPAAVASPRTSCCSSTCWQSALTSSPRVTASCASTARSSDGFRPSIQSVARCHNGAGSACCTMGSCWSVRPSIAVSIAASLARSAPARCSASTSAARSIHPSASRPKLDRRAIDPATVLHLLCHIPSVTRSGSMIAKRKGGIRASVVPDKSRG